jgi:hypothetical protein
LQRPAFSSRNNPSRGQWFYKDVDEMADYYDTDAIFVDAVKGAFQRDLSIHPMD